MTAGAITLYVEGGGHGRDGKAALRQGFDILLAKQKLRARDRQWRWRLTMCGSRSEAYRAFTHAVKDRLAGVVGLLVDSEGPVFDASPGGRVTHLAGRDGWDLAGAPADSVHLMIQCMETWLVADAAALAAVYGQGFQARSLSSRRDLDGESKADVLASLDRATRRTARAGYGKIRDASAVLGKSSPETIAARCPSFAVFRSWLDEAIG